MVDNNSNKEDMRVSLTEALLTVSKSYSYPGISERDWTIVSMYVKGMDSSQIGRQYNLSSQRIRKILSTCLNKMRKIDVNYHELYLETKAENERLQRELNALRFGKETIRRRKEDVIHKDGVLISDCEVSKHLLKALKVNFPDVDTIPELATLTRKQIQHADRLGRDSLDRIEELLAQFGYKLRADKIARRQSNDPQSLPQVEE